MEIKFYLGEAEVPAAQFKQYSYRCHFWINILQEYKDVFDNAEEELTLIYHPAANDVEAVYEHSSVLDIVSEQAKSISYQKRTSEPANARSVAA